MSIRKTLTRLLLEQPFYGYLAASLVPVATEELPRIEAGGTTDYPKLFYNPLWWEALPESSRKGAVLHALLHYILLHAQRQASRKAVLWAVACDMAVYEHIPEDLHPPEALTVRAVERVMQREFPRRKSAELYYGLISEGDDPGFLTGADGREILLMTEGDRELKSQTFSDQPLTEMELKSLKSNLAEALEEAGNEGEVPPGIEALTDQVFGEFRIQWRKVLKRFLSGRGRVIKRKSWKKASRRFDGNPGVKRSVGITALVAVDESASISDGLLAAFYRELREIHSITGTLIQVTRFDSTCTPPVPLDRYLQAASREKGGGTDFRPIFTLADRLGIPLVVIFTDGDGKAPKEASQKTLWVIAPGGKKPAPFGTYVNYKESV